MGAGTLEKAIVYCEYESERAGEGVKERKGENRRKGENEKGEKKSTGFYFLNH